MYQLEDGNTSALNNYLSSQEFLEHSFEYSKPQKQEAVIAYAVKIMEGKVSNQEFLYAFGEFYEDSDFEEDIYTKEFQEALDNWNLGVKPSDEFEYEMLWKVTHAALEASSQINYDIEFEELFDNLGKAIKGVIAND